MRGVSMMWDAVPSEDGPNAALTITLARKDATLLYCALWAAANGPTPDTPATHAQVRKVARVANWTFLEALGTGVPATVCATCGTPTTDLTRGVCPGCAAILTAIGQRPGTNTDDEAPE
jgi:hypothetical protein